MATRGVVARDDNGEVRLVHLQAEGIYRGLDNHLFTSTGVRCIGSMELGVAHSRGLLRVGAGQGCVCVCRRTTA
jgi:hypothetical protein